MKERKTEKRRQLKGGMEKEKNERKTMIKVEGKIKYKGKRIQRKKERK